MITRRATPALPQIDTNEGHVLFVDESFKADYKTCGIIHIHGLGALADSPLNRPDVYGSVVQRIAATRPVLSVDADTASSWGNDAAVAQMRVDRKWMENVVKTRPGKSILWGLSMGAAVALNALRDEPTKYCACILTIPGVDLLDLQSRNAGALNAGIDTAYGGDPATSKDPARNAAAIAALGVPIYIAYGGSDPTIGVTPVTDFATALNAAVAGICTSVSIGANVGHDQTPLDVPALLTWIASKAPDSATGPDAAGSEFLTANFTGTAGTTLQTYTPEVGTLTKHAAGPLDAVLTDAGAARTTDTVNNSGQDSIYYGPAPATAEYDTIVRVKNVNVLQGNFFVFGRLSTGASFDGYGLSIHQSGVLDFYRFAAAAVAAVLWTGIAWVPQDGEFRLQVRDGIQRVFWTADNGPAAGVRQQLGPTTYDATVTAAGRPGIQMRNIATDTTGLHAESFRAVNV